MHTSPPPIERISLLKATEHIPSASVEGILSKIGDLDRGSIKAAQSCVPEEQNLNNTLNNFK
jgi:hypothetical protein